MTVSGSSSLSLLESALGAVRLREQIGVAVLMKARQVTEQQGQAMLTLLEQAVPPPAPGSDPDRLDAYA